jgi:hypothetical protein
LGNDATAISTTLLGSGTFFAVFGGGSFASATIIGSGAFESPYYGTSSGTVILSGGQEYVGEYNDPTATPKSFATLISGAPRPSDTMAKRSARPSMPVWKSRQPAARPSIPR